MNKTNIKYYIKKVDGLVLPVRANESDAGYDVVATSGPKIVGVEILNYNGCHFAEDEEGMKGITPTRTGAYAEIAYVEYETNLYICPSTTQQMIPSGVWSDDNSIGYQQFHTDLRPRSSISKYNLVLANSIGLIDRGYKNQVLCRFKYIMQPRDITLIGFRKEQVCQPNIGKMYKKSDKIAQILPIPTFNIDFTIVDELPGDDRGGGFGSTGR